LRSFIDNSIIYHDDRKVEGENLKNANFSVNGTEYSRRKLLIIAELGTSHGADLIKARDLIDAAAEAGADCIKFQMVYAHEILHPNTGDVDLPGGKIRLYDRFKELELPLSFYAQVKEMVENKGLLFLCTPFGLQSARDLKTLKPRCIKIASPELNFTALLKEVSSYKLPILLSSGVSKLADIEQALEITGTTKVDTCLLHCVTAYPAPESDYNLRVLNNLGAIFGISTGISDHSLDPFLVPVLGAAMGAVVIEKHFCLSQKDAGLDDPIALAPAPFAQMVQAVRVAEKTSGEETINAMKRERGGALVESILGDGIKRLAPSEKANYERTNRSLHALRDIYEGEIITEALATSLRTEKVLRPGLPPSWERRIIGRKAAAFIPAGEGIRFEDLT
jgi:sialic acid synthase SpsE